MPDNVRRGKYNYDRKWDGLKGGITNCTLSKEEVI